VPRTGGEQRRTTIVEEAIHQFGRDGYKGASLESIATAVGVRKQTLLYYFPSKEALLEACLQAAGERLGVTIATAIEGTTTYWGSAEAVIHGVFGLAADWPEFRQRAIEFLQAGMDAGEIRKQDPAMLLFTLYTAVVGSLTEASVLDAVVGSDTGRASLRRREREVVLFVRAALRPAGD
jgi:AcrR family transcriptional regulator